MNGRGGQNNEMQKKRGEEWRTRIGWPKQPSFETGSRAGGLGILRV